MRHDSLIRVLAAVSFFSFVAVHPASAIEASAVYPQVSALEGVRLTEASEARPAIEIAWRDESGLRISSTPPMHLSPGFTRDRPRTLELSFAAPHTVTGIGLDVEFEADGFRGWAEGRTQLSWNGAFRTRLANAAKWKLERGGPTRPPRPPLDLSSEEAWLK